MGEFNSDENYIYHCGQECLEEMEQPSESARVWNAVLGGDLKNNRMIAVHPQGKLMLLNCGVGEDSQQSLGLQGDPTSSS